MRQLTGSIVWLLGMCVLAAAQPSVDLLLQRKLEYQIKELDSRVAGVIGVAALDLTTGQIFDHNGSSVFPQASVIKIPIMVEVFRRVEAGELDWKTGPVNPSVRELVEKMIRDSDNTATNKLIDMMGMDSVNRWIGSVGLKHTRLQRRMLDGEAAAANRENLSTPLEMIRIVELLYKGKLVNAKASADMIQILKTVKADFRVAIPDAVAVASKPGDLSGVRAETGIVFLAKRPFALSIMSTYLDDKANPVPEIVKLIFQHFEKLASSNRYGHKLQ